MASLGGGVSSSQQWVRPSSRQMGKAFDGERRRWPTALSDTEAVTRATPRQAKLVKVKGDIKRARPSQQFDTDDGNQPLLLDLVEEDSRSSLPSTPVPPVPELPPPLARARYMTEEEEDGRYAGPLILGELAALRLLFHALRRLGDKSARDVYGSAAAAR